jgi:hypothetical protein
VRPRFDGLTWVALGALALVAVLALASGDYVGVSTAAFLACLLILLAADNSGRTQMVEGSRLAAQIGVAMLALGLGLLAAWILFDVSRWYYAVGFWIGTPGAWLIHRSRNRRAHDHARARQREVTRSLRAITALASA